MRIKTRMARGYRAIRLLGMEKKKKEKDGEAIKQRLWRPADVLKISSEPEFNLKIP